jgi:2-dehydro-3-deoxygluconokinase
MTRIIAFGEIMARFSSPGYLRLTQCMPGALNVLFAGAEASVAMSIAHLGGRASFVTALPRHAIADACIATLRGVGVDTDRILRTDAGRLGLYFLEAGINQRPSQVIYDREGSSIALTPPDTYDWDAIFADAQWLVVSGITPALSRTAAETTLHALGEATQRGVRVLCDLNYRAKLWRWDPATPPRTLAMQTIRMMLPSVDLFIAGADEIEELLGDTALAPFDAAALDRESHFAAAAGRLVERYPRLTRVASTWRRSYSASSYELGGMLWDAAAGQHFSAPLVRDVFEPYQVGQVVDRIGTGDAFTAALLHALTVPELSQSQTALSFATAAFCLAHSIDGDFNASTRAEIEALVDGDGSGRVQR